MSFSFGAFYRQANYVFYKLMKAGPDFQLVVRSPYLHPVIRTSLGYARVFGGSFAALNLPTNGLFFSLGVGIRVPLIRGISLLGAFDWTVVQIYPKGGEGFRTIGQQLGGTFALTFHFVGLGRD